MLKKLFEENFGFDFQAEVYTNVSVATQAFEQFKKSNESFFSYDKREIIFGYLLSYAVERQFMNSAFTPKAKYSVSINQVNKYKGKALYINTEDFILSIGRTTDSKRLLSSSKYKLELAKRNTGFSSQMMLQFEQDKIKLVNEKKYAIISYGYSLGELKHLTIAIPSSDYKKIEYSEDLLENVPKYNDYIPQESTEEQIVNLKSEMQAAIEK